MTGSTENYNHVKIPKKVGPKKAVRSKWPEAKLIEKRLASARACLGSLPNVVFVDKSSSSGLVRDIQEIAPNEALILSDLMLGFEQFNKICLSGALSAPIENGYIEMASLFDSIEKDAIYLLKFLEKPRSRAEDFIQHWRSEMTRRHRGTLHERFEKVQGLAEKTFENTESQVIRERALLDAYSDLKAGMKASSLLVEKIKVLVQARIEKEKSDLADTLKAKEDVSNQSSIVMLEADIAVDDALRCVEKSERVMMSLDALIYHFSHSLIFGEMVHMRQQQVTEAKECLWRHSSQFVSTNGSMFTGLQATLRSTLELNEATKMMTTLSGVNNKSAKLLSSHGNAVQTNAIEASFKTGLKIETVRQLVSSIADYKNKSQDLIANLQRKSMQEEHAIHSIIQNQKTSGAQNNEKIDAHEISEDGIVFTVKDSAPLKPIEWRFDVIEEPAEEDERQALEMSRALVKDALDRNLDKNLLMVAEINKKSVFNVRALLEAGANPLYRLGQKTGVELALQKDHQEIVNLLVRFATLPESTGQKEQAMCAKVAVALAPYWDELAIFSAIWPLEWRQSHQWDRALAQHHSQGVLSKDPESLSKIKFIWKNELKEKDNDKDEQYEKNEAKDGEGESENEGESKKHIVLVVAEKDKQAKNSDSEFLGHSIKLN